MASTQRLLPMRMRCLHHLGRIRFPSREDRVAELVAVLGITALAPSLVGILNHLGPWWDAIPAAAGTTLLAWGVGHVALGDRSVRSTILVAAASLILIGAGVLGIAADDGRASTPAAAGAPGQISGGDANLEVANLTQELPFSQHQHGAPRDVLGVPRLPVQPRTGESLGRTGGSEL